MRSSPSSAPRSTPRRAVIRVDGKRIPVAQAHVYLVANKPRGVVSSMADEEGRRDLSVARRRPARAAVPRRPARHRHRRADRADQRRRVRAPAGPPVVRAAEDLRRPGRGRRQAARYAVSCSPGSTLEDGPVGRDAFRVVSSECGQSLVELVLHEGRNHIVRRLLAEVGHPVLRLSRTAIGPVRLGDLRSGPRPRAHRRRARDAARRRRSLSRCTAGLMHGSAGRRDRPARRGACVRACCSDRLGASLARHGWTM